LEQKTHQEVKEPEISVRYLADFMAASERKRRSIVEGCKYRPIARLVQHKEATLTISEAIRSGPLSSQALKEKADFIRSKLADDDFEALTNEVNADYVEKFSEIVANIKLPDADVLPGKADGAPQAASGPPRSGRRYCLLIPATQRSQRRGVRRQAWPMLCLAFCGAGTCMKECPTCQHLFAVF
jgi:hypothetical protein